MYIYLIVVLDKDLVVYLNIIVVLNKDLVSLFYSRGLVKVLEVFLLFS